MMSIRGAELLFRITLTAVIAIESLLTVFHSLRSTTESHLGTILPWFAGAEALAAVMLLFPQTVKIGGWVLILIFLVALIVHGPAKQMHLLVYAAGVVLIMTAAGRTAANTKAQEANNNEIKN